MRYCNSQKHLGYLLRRYYYVRVQPCEVLRVYLNALLTTTSILSLSASASDAASMITTKVTAPSPIATALRCV
jgi:hypothetical protein